MSLTHELDQSDTLHLGAVLYPASAEKPASFGLRIERGDQPSKSLIPWTCIRTGTIRSTGTTDCCYSANGSLVISWRSLGSEKARLQGTSLQETAIQARVFSHNGYADGNSEMIFAVPALASIQHSSTLRVDENYLRYVLGDGADVRIGLVPAETTSLQAGASV